MISASFLPRKFVTYVFLITAPSRTHTLEFLLSNTTRSPTCFAPPRTPLCTPHYSPLNDSPLNRCLGLPMDFYSRFAFSAALVFTCLVMPWIVGAFVACVMACRATNAREGGGRLQRVTSTATEGDPGDGGGRGGENQPFRSKFRAKWHRILPTAARYSLIVVLFAHPAVSGQTFLFFSCQTIDDGSYLVADYSLRCDDDGWQRMLPFALFMVIGFVVGVPLMLLILLCRYV